MKKKLVSLMLVAMMVVSSLTGCSSVTAESLVDNMFKDLTYMECEMEMDLEMEVSVSGLSVDMVMGVDADIETSEDVAHIIMSMDMDMMGMSESVETEMYTVTEKDTVTTYTYDETYGQWYYTESELDDDETVEITSDMFEDLEMEKTDDGYVVTGVLTDLKDILKTVNLDEDTFGEYIDIFSEIEILVTMTFNKDQVIEEMVIEFNVDEDEVFEIEDVGELSISKLEAKAEYKNVNEDEEVKIPDDVIDEAVEADELGGLDDFEDYEDEESEYTGEEYAPIGGITGTNEPTLDNLVFTIKGNSYNVGAFTLDDMKDLGYYIDDYDYTEGDEYYINAGDYDYIYLVDDNYCSMYLYFKNNTSGGLDILDCDLVGIDFSQSYEMEYEGGTHCDFDIMGVSAGVSAEEVEYILGTPDDYSTYDTSTSLYYYLDDSYGSQLIIDVDAELGVTGFDVYVGLY